MSQRSYLYIYIYMGGVVKHNFFTSLFSFIRGRKRERGNREGMNEWERNEGNERERKGMREWYIKVENERDRQEMRKEENYRD